MTTVSIRLSGREKEELRKYGRLSTVVRDAIDLYLATMRSKRAIQRLRELQQESELRSHIETDIRLLKEDRER
jgi:hypothetical protein